MSKRTRSQVMVVILIIFLAGLRLVMQADPIAELLQKVTMPVAEVVYPIAVPDSNSEAQNNAEAELTAVLLEEMRAQLNLPAEGLTYLNADVTRRDIGGVRKSVWINRGSNDGVRKNQAVVSGSFLIGKVIEANPSFSEVQLVTDPAFRVSATADGNMGIALSQAGSLVFDLVPAANASGATAISDGVDGVFPPGLAIGLLGENISDGTSVFNSYRLILGQNPADIKFLSVVVDG